MMPRIPDEELPIIKAFNDDIRAHGIRQPLLVDSEMQILDGRRRWELALELGLEVEVTVCEDSPMMAILGSLTQRRHMTKGQLAYTAYPLLRPALEEAKQRKLDALKQGDKVPVVDSIDYGRGTVEDLARSLGFGRDLIFQAKQLHESCGSDDELRAQVEISLFHDGVGLGALLAGIAGRSATKGKERAPEQLFFGALKAYKAAATFTDRWSRLELYSDTNLITTREELRLNFSKLPDEAVDEMESAIRQIRRERKDVA